MNQLQTVASYRLLKELYYLILIKSSENHWRIPRNCGLSPTDKLPEDNNTMVIELSLFGPQCTNYSAAAEIMFGLCSEMRHINI